MEDEFEYRWDHVQLAIPPASEDACRAFYVGLLGLREVQKPEPLAARGGLWLQGSGLQLHLGVELDFRPALKAHPALALDRLDRLAQRLERAGVEVGWDDNLPGRSRFYAHDPVGNRLEFVSAAG